jgi:serine/threonine protein kinase
MLQRTSNSDLFREVQPDRNPHGVAVDIWAVGVLALKLLAGYDNAAAVEPLENSTARDIETTVIELNVQRDGKENGPISQNGVDFITSCLNPRPGERPTAADAAKHAWFRESEQEVTLFKEREKNLTWKPRGLIIPAVSRLKDVAQVTTINKPKPVNGQSTPIKDDVRNEQRPSNFQEETGSQLFSSLPIPDSVDDSQSSRDIHQPKFAWLNQRLETMVDFARPYSTTNYRSASAA